jgi:hypothetical protein
MTSDQQIEANRKNALKSCGPKTQLGKETVRLNALKHGCRAQTIEVLPKEKSAEFTRHVDAWLDEFAPATPSERYFIRHAATLAWKLDRADRFEEAMLAHRVDETISACDDGCDGQVEEAAALVLFDSSRQGEQLRRYQLSMHRELRKDLETFSKLRRQAPTWNPMGPIGANKPISDAPNKPISDGTSAAEKEAHAATLEPVSVSAPNKPICSQPDAPNKPISASELLSVSRENRGKRRPDPTRLLKELRARARSKEPAPDARRGKPVRVTPETPLLS